MLELVLSIFVRCSSEGALGLKTSFLNQKRHAPAAEVTQRGIYNDHRNLTCHFRMSCLLGGKGQLIPRALAGPNLELFQAEIIH